MRRLDSGLDGAPLLLQEATADFLKDDSRQVMGLQGDAGSGKTLFCQQLCKQLQEPVAAFLWKPLTGERPRGPLQVPIFIELKHFRASQLHGVLVRHLIQCGLSRDAVDALRQQPARNVRVQLVALLDGYDEVFDDGGVQDVLSSVCGDEPWPVCVLKVVLTSRANRMISLQNKGIPGSTTEAHPTWLTLLPFSSSKVGRGLGPSAVLCCPLDQISK